MRIYPRITKVHCRQRKGDAQGKSKERKRLSDMTAAKMRKAKGKEIFLDACNHQVMSALTSCKLVKHTLVSRWHEIRTFGPIHL